MILFRHKLKSDKIYSHVFFDLDHTLWDFEKNSRATLKELFIKYQLGLKIDSEEIFISTYQTINKELWTLYHRNEIDKETLRIARFAVTFNQFGIEDLEMAKNFGDDYIEVSPHKGQLFDGAIEVLQYLKTKYKLHLITNGFKEVQHIKISSSGLDNFFDQIIISEEVGFMKPDAAIFKYALNKANAKVTETIMIGDNVEADIMGANNVGIDTVFFNPEKIDVQVKCNYHINDLRELLRVL